MKTESYRLNFPFVMELFHPTNKTLLYIVNKIYKPSFDQIRPGVSGGVGIYVDSHVTGFLRRRMMSTDNFREQHPLGVGKDWCGFHEVVCPRPQAALGVTAS